MHMLYSIRCCPGHILATLLHDCLLTLRRLTVKEKKQTGNTLDIIIYKLYAVKFHYSLGHFTHLLPGKLYDIPVPYFATTLLVQKESGSCFNSSINPTSLTAIQAHLIASLNLSISPH